MPKRKITVTYEGQVIGTRQTDRVYTHALVLIEFSAEALRARYVREWSAYGINNARSGHRHALEAQHLTYRFARGVSDAQRAHYAQVAATPLGQFIEDQHAAFNERAEEHIAALSTRGATVLSYHGSAERAHKALAAAQAVHSEYRVVIVPVDAAPTLATPRLDGANAAR